jgi:hypothetical protein
MTVEVDAEDKDLRTIEGGGYESGVYEPSAGADGGVRCKSLSGSGGLASSGSIIEY